MQWGVTFGPGSQLLPLNRSMEATALGSQLDLELELVLYETGLGGSLSLG